MYARACRRLWYGQAKEITLVYVHQNTVDSVDSGFWRVHYHEVRLQYSNINNTKDKVTVVCNSEHLCFLATLIRVATVYMCLDVSASASYQVLGLDLKVCNSCKHWKERDHGDWSTAFTWWYVSASHLVYKCMRKTTNSVKSTKTLSRGEMIYELM